MAQKPNCYACRWRGIILGDAHSRCLHPDIGWSDDLIGNLAKTLCGDYDDAKYQLGVSANFYGVQNGWFLWPANFDPVWLITCKGFTPKEDKGTT